MLRKAFWAKIFFLLVSIMNEHPIYQKALAEFDAGNFQLSIEQFNSIEFLFNECFEFYRDRGNAYSGIENYINSIQDYSTAIRLCPLNAENYSNRAKSFLIIKKYENSLDDINKAIEINPENVHFREIRGLIFSYSDDYMNAFEDFAFVVEREPDNIEAKRNYLIIKEKIYNGYANFDPISSEDFRKRGVSRLDDRFYMDAIKDFNVSLEIDPQNQYSYKARGVTHMLMGEFANAIDDFKNAIALNRCADYLDNLADAYLKSGELKLAIKYFDEAVSLSKNNDARMIYNRGVAFRKDNDLRKAIIDFNKVIELDVNYLEAYNNRAWCFKQLGMFDQAMSDYDMYENLNRRYQNGM